MSLSMQVAIEIEPINIDERTPACWVLRELNKTINRFSGNGEGFTYQSGRIEDALTDDTLWYDLWNEPDEKNAYRWLAVYPVRGNSEGHYIHVDLVSGTGLDGRCKSKIILLSKTFRGFEYAQKLANITQFVLTNGCGVP